MKTYVPSKNEITRRWHVIDANSRVLGRIATQAAKLLQGKHKPRYTPFLDLGDHVIIVNAGKIVMTGNKMEKREIFSHTGCRFRGTVRDHSIETVQIFASTEP